MTNSEIAVLTFPLAGALAVASIVWLVTSVSVRRSNALQAKREKQALRDLTNVLKEGDVLQTPSGIWIKMR